MSTGLIPGANGDSSICNDGNLDSLVYAVYGFMPISILKAASSSTPRNGHAYKSFSPFRGTIGACFTLHSSLFTLHSLLSLHPVRYEDISFPGNLIVAVRSEDEPSAVRGEHRAAIECRIVGYSLEPGPVHVHHVEIEVPSLRIG